MELIISTHSITFRKELCFPLISSPLNIDVYITCHVENQRKVRLTVFLCDKNAMNLRRHIGYDSEHEIIVKIRFCYFYIMGLIH